MAFVLDIDFESRYRRGKSLKTDALVIIGGGRYVVVRPGQAEIAFVIIDTYQAQGIGTLLMRHLGALARDAGLKELIAEALPKNIAVLNVFRKFGFLSGSQRASQVAHLALKLV